jgi:hypothetical protein
LGYYLKIRPRPLPAKPFSIHHSLVILSSTLYSLRTEKASLNKLTTPHKNDLVSVVTKLSPWLTGASFGIHVRRLNSRHFRKVEATGLKIMASKSPSLS